jgi:hypothetical protein
MLRPRTATTGAARAAHQVLGPQQNQLFFPSPRALPSIWTTVQPTLKLSRMLSQPREAIFSGLPGVGLGSTWEAGGSTP